MHPEFHAQPARLAEDAIQVGEVVGAVLPRFDPVGQRIIVDAVYALLSGEAVETGLGKHEQRYLSYQAEREVVLDLLGGNHLVRGKLGGRRQDHLLEMESRALRRNLAGNALLRPRSEGAVLPRQGARLQRERIQRRQPLRVLAIEQAQVSRVQDLQHLQDHPVHLHPRLAGARLGLGEERGHAGGNLPARLHVLHPLFQAVSGFLQRCFRHQEPAVLAQHPQRLLPDPVHLFDGRVLQRQHQHPANALYFEPEVRLHPIAHVAAVVGVRERGPPTPGLGVGAGRRGGACVEAVAIRCVQEPLDQGLIPAVRIVVAEGDQQRRLLLYHGGIHLQNDGAVLRLRGRHPADLPALEVGLLLLVGRRNPPRAGRVAEVYVEDLRLQLGGVDLTGCRSLCHTQSQGREKQPAAEPRPKHSGSAHIVLRWAGSDQLSVTSDRYQ